MKINGEQVKQILGIDQVNALWGAEEELHCAVCRSAEIQGVAVTDYGQYPICRKHSARYQVMPVADENCDSLTDDLCFASDSLDEVREWINNNANFPWGVGIEDTETGLIDFGHGFGVEVTIPEQQ